MMETDLRRDARSPLSQADQQNVNYQPQYTRTYEAQQTVGQGAFSYHPAMVSTDSPAYQTTYQTQESSYGRGPASLPYPSSLVYQLDTSQSSSAEGSAQEQLNSRQRIQSESLPIPQRPHTGYQRVTAASQRTFFCPGRVSSMRISLFSVHILKSEQVFIAWWISAAADLSENVTRKSEHLSRDQFGQLVYSEPRRFIVVENLGVRSICM